MKEFTLIVDSNEFKEFLKKDLRNSSKKAYFLMLSFEMDEAGKFLINELSQSNIADKRIIVDRYTQYVISDKFLYSPKNFFNSELRKEKNLTFSTIKVHPYGIKFKWTNKVGFLLRKFIKRNHKKMILLDNNITYIGGINFSEHNFLWHDLMIRIESEKIQKFFEKDFIDCWEGRKKYRAFFSEDLEIHLLDGEKNEKIFNDIFRRYISLAEDTIYIHTPYLTFPFFSLIKKYAQKNVKIRIITPLYNNKNIVKEILLIEASNYSFEVFLYKNKMSHLKAILIDNKYLITGSSNFDYLSFKSEEEVVAIFKNKNLVNEFKERVVERDLKFSSRENLKKITFSQKLKKLMFKSSLRFLELISK